MVVEGCEPLQIQEISLSPVVLLSLKVTLGMGEEGC